jgi:uncharacterized protein (DUF2147 family)
MKKFTLFIHFILFSLIAVCQSGQGDQIVGEWLNEEKDAKIEIYKEGSAYFGKVIWGTEFLESDGQTSRKDAKNPDEKLRARNLIDTPLLNDFAYVDGIWDNGTYYDFKSGKTYSCTIKIKNNKLEIRSYVGVPLFGKSTYWEKMD